MKKLLLLASVITFVFCMNISGADAADRQISVGIPEGIELYGDVRARAEWDKRQKASESYVKKNRDRIRYRFRVGLNYTPPKYGEYFEAGVRATTGTKEDANSPHQTLGGSSKADINIDKVFIKGKYRDGWIWFGKNSMPLWQQNEYFWDTDANPEGIAVGYLFKNIGSLPVTAVVQGGHFILDEGSWNNADQGDEDVDLWSAQAVVKVDLDKVQFTSSYGVLHTDEGACVRYQAGGTTSPCSASNKGIGTVDADFSIASLQAKLKHSDNLSFTVGFDRMKGDVNGEVTDKEKDSGWVAAAGFSYKRFSAKLSLLDIEKYAVSAFAQDNWANYYSDFEGYEATVVYKFTKKINADIKRFDGERKLDSKEKEERTQVNINVKF